jgi:hypothetical protein
MREGLSELAERIFTPADYRRFQQELKHRPPESMEWEVLMGLNWLYFNRQMDDMEATACYGIMGLSIQTMEAARSRATYVEVSGYDFH